MDNHSAKQYPEWYSEIPLSQQDKYIKVYGAFIGRFRRTAERIINKPVYIWLDTNDDHPTMFRVTFHVSVDIGEDRLVWDIPIDVRVVQDPKHYVSVVRQFISTYADRVMFFLEHEYLP